MQRKIRACVYLMTFRKHIYKYFNKYDVIYLEELPLYHFKLEVVYALIYVK